MWMTTTWWLVNLEVLYPLKSWIQFFSSCTPWSPRLLKPLIWFPPYPSVFSFLKPPPKICQNPWPPCPPGEQRRKSFDEQLWDSARRCQWPTKFLHSWEDGIQLKTINSGAGGLSLNMDIRKIESKRLTMRNDINAKRYSLCTVSQEVWANVFTLVTRNSSTNYNLTKLK